MNRPNKGKRIAELKRLEKKWGIPKEKLQENIKKPNSKLNKKKSLIEKQKLEAKLYKKKKKAKRLEQAKKMGLTLSEYEKRFGLKRTKVKNFLNTTLPEVNDPTAVSAMKRKRKYKKIAEKKRANKLQKELEVEAEKRDMSVNYFKRNFPGKVKSIKTKLLPAKKRSVWIKK